MSLQIWLLASRPKTLSISIIPVLTGSALAWRHGQDPLWWPFMAALLAAMLIQIGTNLHNDAADFARGADTPDRLGPARAVASGWLSGAAVERAALGCFGLALACGVYLVWHGGWPILLLGLAALASGWAYTGGSRPLAYTGLGEVFVWLFFGLAAVMGSFYLQTLSLSWSAFVAANMLGLLAAAVIVVNNYRDLEGDTRAGKRTLAVRLGRGGSRVEYALLLLIPYALLFPYVLLSPYASLARLDFLVSSQWRLLLPLLSLPWALALIWRFMREPVGSVFNRILAQTALLQLVFGLLLCLGLWI